MDVDLDDKKILEGMSRVVLTSDGMVESISQGNEFRTALDLDPLVSDWAKLFHKTTDLTENDCLWKDLENEVEQIRASLVIAEKEFIDMCNRYEWILDPFPLMNERCFSADYPCWRYSSIPVMNLSSSQLEREQRSWIGTQLSKQLLHRCTRKRDELAINVLYLEAYVRGWVISKVDRN